MKKYLIALLLVGVATTSCYEKLNIAPPNAITSDQIQDILENGSETEIVNLLGGITAVLPQRFQGDATGTLSDTRTTTILNLLTMRNLEGNDVALSDARYTNVSEFAGTQEYAFTNLRSAESNKNYPHWKYAWDNINHANKVLAILTDDIVGDNPTLLGYQAQAFVIRAYSYNFLMENYQDSYTNGGVNKLGVPIYTVFDPTQETKPRAGATETYDSILRWAQRGVSQLKAAGIAYTSNTEDIDLGVANFVLARAALARGDWNTVITACNEIMNGVPNFITERYYVARDLAVDSTDPEYDGALYLADSLAFTNIDPSVNPEVIFGFTYDNQTNNARTLEPLLNALGTGSGGAGYGWRRIDERLYNQINDNDFRKYNFMAKDTTFVYASSPSVISIPVLTTKKWASTAGKGETSNDNSLATNSRFDNCMMRLSEAVLMLAEAQYMAGATGDAETTINKLLAARTKAGQPTLRFDNYGFSGDLLEFIKLQTRIEMWNENGLEYYNNKRWNIPVQRSGSTTHPLQNSYSVADMTLLIPADEINNNNNAVQN